MKKMMNAMIVMGLFLLTGCSTFRMESEPVEYRVGDKGPAGGVIFYDDQADGTDDIPDARYLEAAPKDLKGTYSWGEADVYVGSDGSRFGAGAKAAQMLVELHPKKKYAANACDRYRAGWHSDWFFPDRGMVNLMFEELKQEGLGGFTDSVYSSSGEDDEMYAEVVDFSNGHLILSTKDVELKVRPVRAF